jgi:hypothetical protein
MSKILMTGYTPRAVGSTRLLYSYMSNTAVIKKMLIAAGHEVDQRIVDVDEPDLAKNYDLALVGIAVPQSLSSRYVFGALWAAESLGVDRVRWYVDDWLLHQMRSQLDSALREPEKRMFSLDNRHGYDLAKKHIETWKKWYHFQAKSKYRLLLPCFPWSRPRLLLPKLDNVEPYIFDPTPLALTDPEVMCGSEHPVTIPVIAPEDREKAWTLAAMRDIKAWYDKQRFEWPVIKYGNKRQQEEIVEEVHLLTDIYPKRWGVIGAPYPNVAAGCGWRARYIHSALTKSILFLDPEEGRTAGQPYNLFRSKVESASTQELIDIAEKQAVHLKTNTWSLDQLIAKLDEYVKV